MKKYPLKLDYIAKTAIWGGSKLSRDFGKQSNFENISESWELSVRKNEKSAIENGVCKGMTLEEYIDKCGEGSVSSTYKKGDRFPLLIKFIDAADDLSVQVHPDNFFAEKLEGDMGKTEMWYIVSAEEGAKLAYGLADGVDTEKFSSLVKENKIKDAIKYIPVKAGESYFIPAGMLHAIGAGIIIAEIQQNSDITYRVYDYDRRQPDGTLRQLHVEKALEVTREFTDKEIEEWAYSKGKIKAESEDEEILANSEYFRVKKHTIKGTKKFSADGDSFVSLLCISGEGSIVFEGEKYPVCKGDSYYIPAGMGEFFLSGEVEIIDSRV